MSICFYLKCLITLLFSVSNLNYKYSIIYTIVCTIYTFASEILSVILLSFLNIYFEFSTNEKVAMEVLKGDRFVSLDELEVGSRDHKRNLAQSIEKVADGEHSNIIELENLQYFDGTGIKPEIVGTITGMILGYCNWKKPVIGFTETDNDGIKVSLRCSRLLSYDGIHFGNIIRKIASEVGGSGGGHSMACGAYIPIDKKSDFIERFNNELEGKLTN